MNHTLEYYNKQAEVFVENTKKADMSETQEKFLNQLNLGAKILDLGSGSGRDSKVFLDAGYQVTAVDGSSELCKLASKYIGQEVLCQRFEEISFMEEYDGIWASASILHVPYKELENMLMRIWKALKPAGILYMSFKYGDFEGMRNGRYFTDMNEMKIQKLHSNIPIFDEIAVWITADVRKERNDEKWMNLLWRK